MANYKNKLHSISMRIQEVVGEKFLFKALLMASLLLSAVCNNANCQNPMQDSLTVITTIPPDTSDTYDESYGTLEVYYGNYIYNRDNNHVTNTFANYRFGQPVQSVGIAYTIETILNRKFGTELQFGYVFVIPQKVVVNDTIQGNLGGFSLRYPHFGINVTPYVPWLDLTLGLGANMGRLRISTSEYRAQKNPYFAPVLLLNPRFKVNNLSFSIRAEYQFDISKKSWRSVTLTAKEQGFPLEKFNQTGLLLFFSLGYTLYQ